MTEIPGAEERQASPEASVDGDMSTSQSPSPPKSTPSGGSPARRRTVDDRPGIGTLPLVVAVTGHRDLRPQDVPSLEGAVRGIFDTLHKDYPHTPLLLLSQLAEGADRLVARIALASGARLVCPMPMPHDSYMQDFETAESRKDFETLLEQTDHHFELHLVGGATLDSIAADSDERAKQYAHAGVYMVRHCQILIALWDGVDVDQAGGTSQTVKYMLEGPPYDLDGAESQLDPKRTGPVYHIRTPRLKNPDIDGTLFEVNLLLPGGYSSEVAAAAAFAQNRVQVEEYNHDVVDVGSQMQDDVVRNKGYVVPPEREARLTPSIATLLEHYAMADTLAQRFQLLTLHTVRSLFSLAAVSMVFFVLYGEFRENLWLLGLSVISPLPMYMIYFNARKGNHHARHLDYRALAEGLRIQLFWHLAGLREPVARHYLRKQRSELDWIRDAIMTWNLPVESRHTKADIPAVMEHWVDDQRRYFRKSAGRNQKTVEAYETWVRRLFTITGGLTAVLVLLTVLRGFAESAFGKIPVETLHTTLMVLIVILPGTAGILDGYKEKLAFSQQSKQYQRMRDLFEIAAQRLAEAMQANDDEEARVIIRELGEEALAENGDWVIMHRERKVEVPRAG